MNNQNKQIRPTLNPQFIEEFDRRHDQGQKNGVEITMDLQAEGIGRYIPEPKLGIVPDINDDDPEKYTNLGNQMALYVGETALLQAVRTPSYVTATRKKRPLSWRERRKY